MAVVRFSQAVLRMTATNSQTLGIIHFLCGSGGIGGIKCRGRFQEIWSQRGWTAAEI